VTRASPSSDSPPNAPRRSRLPADRTPIRSGDFPTLPKWDKLLKLGLSPEDIAAEKANWQGYASSNWNMFEYTEENWAEIADELGEDDGKPVPKEALKKALTELPMCFAFAFGEEENTALVNLVKSWGMDDFAAIKTAKMIRNIFEVQVACACANVGGKPYATEAGKKLGLPGEVDIPPIPEGEPDIPEGEPEDECSSVPVGDSCVSLIRLSPEHPSPLAPAR